MVEVTQMFYSVAPSVPITDSATLNSLYLARQTALMCSVLNLYMHVCNTLVGPRHK